MNMLYPELSLTEQVTEDLVPRAKRPRKKLDGPFYSRDAITLPTQSYLECDGDSLLAMGGIDKKSNYWSAGMFYLTVGVIMAFISGHAFKKDGVQMFYETDEIWWFVLAIVFLLTGIYNYFKSKYTTFNAFILFNRQAGTVMFPPHKGRKTLVLPFDQVQCYGTMYYHSRGGKHYFTHLAAKKKPRGEKDRDCGIYFSEQYGRTPAEREWKLICQFMDKSQPIPTVLQPSVDEFKRCGLNVCREIIDQAAYDKAMDYEMTTGAVEREAQEQQRKRELLDKMLLK